MKKGKGERCAGESGPDQAEIGSNGSDAKQMGLDEIRGLTTELLVGQEGEREREKRCGAVRCDAM